MTGSGAAVLDGKSGRFETEIRSVNHRFLKTTARSFGPLPSMEGAIEDLVRGRVQRGHVSVVVRYVPPSSARASVDEAAFAAASVRLKALALAHGLPSPTVGEVLAVPGVLESGADEEAPALVERALESVAAALAKLDAAREREGAALHREMSSLLESISKATEAVWRLAESFPETAKRRLQERLADLLGPDVPLDPAQVAREVALLAERSDVREEVARLRAHATHAREILDEGGAAGRRLDFLVQEMHREANTIGSKCDELEVTRAVLAIKADVERLREQAQNVE